MTRREGSRRSWDPLLIVCQIIALQACHYLVLCIITPPMLVMFADPVALSLEGGATNIAMVMDWREMVGKATVEEKIGHYTRLPPSLGRTGTGVGGSNKLEDSSVGADGLVHPYIPHITHDTGEPDAQQHNITDPLELLKETQEKERTEEVEKAAMSGEALAFAAADPIRGWTVGAAWVAASSVDVIFIYHLIRRPTHILDFSTTLIFNHLVLTTYYASSFPTSLFFWAIILGSAALQIIWAEQLCVRREMREGFQVGQGWKTDEREEDALPTHREQSSRPRPQRRNSAPSAPGRYERLPMQDLG